MHEHAYDGNELSRSPSNEGVRPLCTEREAPPGHVSFDHLYDCHKHNGLGATCAPSPSAYRPSKPQLASKRRTLAFSLMVLISASVNPSGLLA